MDNSGFGQTQTQDPFATKLAQRQSAIQQASQKSNAPHYAKGIGGFFEKALPIIGGAAGAIAGVPLDPFTAGMASVVLGGLGSAGAQAGENALTGQKVLQGNVAQQGALGAIPGGLGKVADIGRAAKTGSGILDSLMATKALPSTIGRGADNIATQATNTGLKTNVNNEFQQMGAGASGFNAGARLPGSGPAGIDLAKSQELSKLEAQHGIPQFGVATKMLTAQQKLDQAGQAMEQGLAQKNIPLGQEDLQGIVNSHNTALQTDGKLAGQVTPAVRTQLDKFHAMLTGDGTKLPPGYTAQDVAKIPGLAEQLASGQSPVKDLAGLNRFRMGVDKGINQNAQAGSLTPETQQAAQLFRQHLSDQISRAAPELQKANTDYHQLSQLQEAYQMENQRIQQGGGGLVNRLANSGPVQGARNIVANVGQRATGGVGAATTPSAIGTPASALGALTGKNIAKKLGSQTAVRALAGSSGASQQPQSATGTNFFPSPVDANTPSSTSGLSQQSQNPSISPTQLTELIAADPTHEALYTSLYNTLNKANTSTLDSTQQKDLSTGQAAIGVLNNYMDSINQIYQGSGGNVASGTLANLLGNTPFGSQSDKAAAALQKTRVDTASQIASAMVGGGKPSTQTINRVIDSLPSVNDSPQLAKDKIDKLIQSVQTIMQAQATPVSQIAGSLQ